MHWLDIIHTKSSSLQLGIFVSCFSIVRLTMTEIQQFR